MYIGLIFHVEGSLAKISKTVFVFVMWCDDVKSKHYTRYKCYKYKSSYCVFAVVKCTFLIYYILHQIETVMRDAFPTIPDILSMVKGFLLNVSNNG